MPRRRGSHELHRPGCESAQHRRRAAIDGYRLRLRGFGFEDRVGSGHGRQPRFLLEHLAEGRLRGPTMGGTAVKPTLRPDFTALVDFSEIVSGFAAFCFVLFRNSGGEVAPFTRVVLALSESSGKRTLDERTPTCPARSDALSRCAPNSVLGSRVSATVVGEASKLLAIRLHLPSKELGGGSCWRGAPVHNSTRALRESDRPSSTPWFVRDLLSS